MKSRQVKRNQERRQAKERRTLAKSVFTYEQMKEASARVVAMTLAEIDAALTEAYSERKAKDIRKVIATRLEGGDKQ